MAAVVPSLSKRGRGARGARLSGERLRRTVPHQEAAEDPRSIDDLLRALGEPLAVAPKKSKRRNKQEGLSS